MSTLEPPARAASWLTRLKMKHGRKLVIAMPYVWLILLFLLPFLLPFLQLLLPLLLHMQFEQYVQ